MGDCPTTLYSPSEVARMLAVSVTTIRRYIKRGRIRAQRFPGKRFVIAEGEVILVLHELFD
jgi:excisionase family DNA binding protein